MCGEDVPCSVVGSTTPVHPRVCGEDYRCPLSMRESIGSPPRVRGRLESFFDSRLCAGSPPRVRGRHIVLLGAPGADRFTPACAGKTANANNTFLHSTVHPRVCGEDLKNATSTSLRIGSPPRVRGRLLFDLYSLPLSRFTPACAGKTARIAAFNAPSSVHPRVCGEDSFCAWR